MIVGKLIIAAALIGVAAWLRFGSRNGSRGFFWVPAVAGILLLGSLLWRPTPGVRSDADSGDDGEISPPLRGIAVEQLVPQPAYEAGYLAATACRECHPDHYRSWHRSYHRTMTQPATPEAVVPSFDDVTLTSRGREYHLIRRGEEFWVDMPDPAAELRAYIRKIDLASLPDPPRVVKRVVMTTGSHHHQTYWIRQPSGALLQVPWVYHIKTGRWVFRTDSFLRPPFKEASFNTWNVSCIGCHATGGQPRMDPVRKTMHSAGELGIACEACHGPGAGHVAFHRENQRTSGKRSLADPICNPLYQSAADSARICGQCHLVVERKKLKHWLAHGDPYRPCRDNFEELRRVVRYTKRGGYTGQIVDVDTRFWPDGTVRIGGREYTGLIESACYQHGTGERKLTCISCHSMHSYEDRNHQLAFEMDTNAACTQCHEEPQYDERIFEHTHHSPASSGSLCYNCHMPHTSYALFQAIRSHRIQSPDVAVTTRTGRPNACNLCHLDRTLAWTGEHLRQWYSHPPPTLDEDERNVSAGLLWLLKGDAAQRAITAWNMGRSTAQQTAGAAWMPRFLAELLVDPYSAVRYIAEGSLRTVEGFEDFRYDFDGAARERREARNRAVEMWRWIHRERPAATGDRLLFTAQGRVNVEKLSRLLSERNDREVVISE